MTSLEACVQIIYQRYSILESRVAEPGHDRRVEVGLKTYEYVTVAQLARLRPSESPTIEPRPRCR